MRQDPVADTCVELRQLQLLRAAGLIDHPFGMADPNPRQHLVFLALFWHRGADGLGLFAADLAGRFVAAQGDKSALADQAGAGPLGELDFAHQLRFDPVHATSLGAAQRIGQG
ncbi:hypothetical protein D3C81_1810730 [compost metagenome]